MNTHTLQLATQPFTSIVAGTKVIESRLYDEKRQLIQLGDIVTFANREQPNQTIDVKVVGLLRYPTFDDMFKRNDPLKFGGESIEWLNNQISEFYSLKDQQQNGVLGIEFELI